MGNKTYYIFVLSIIFFSAGCSKQVKREQTPVRFIITGNTLPSSPFVGFTENLPNVLDSISKDNPNLVIYTGNIINGGSDKEGLKKTDIERQYKKFNSLNKKTSIPFYTTIGKKDLYNNSPLQYKKHTGKNLNYSFNYGNSHFIIFNNVNNKNTTSFDKRLKWLSNDLIEHKSYPQIFIITHNPFLSTRKKLTKKGKEFHNIIKFYKVKAVISGRKQIYYETDIEKIKYINAGCRGFTKEDRFFNTSRYYIFSSSVNKLTIRKNKNKYISK